MRGVSARAMGTSQVSEWFGSGPITIPSRPFNALSFPAAVLSSGPYCWYRCAETSGVAAADASGNDRPGAYRGSPTYAQGSIVPNDGTAQSFTMAAGTVGLMSAAFPTTDDWSMMLAFQGDGTSAGTRIMAASSSWYIRCDSGGALKLNTPLGDVSSATVDSADLYDDTPHLLSIVQDRSVGITLYFDGVFAATRSANTPLNAGSWYTGNGIWNEGPYGEYSELAVWDRTLSVEEVQLIARAGGFLA